MAGASDLFSLLAARYGIGTAVSLMGLLSPGQSAAGKGFGATQAAGGALRGLGALSGNQGFSSVGQGLGTAAGLGGLGYGLYNTISDPRLSTGQKAGTSAVQAGEGAVALSPALAGATAGTALGPAFAAVAPAAPYLAAFLAAQALSGQLQKSGSPQLRATGRAIGGPILPATGLINVISGQQSPRAAANATIEGIKQTPIIGKVAGPMMKFIGLGTEPTTGTKFRRELGSVLGQIPQLKGADLTKYNIDPAAFNALSPQVRQAGETLGKILAAYAPSGKKNPNAYAIQAQNILLNRYGNDLPGMLTQVLPMLTGQGQPPSAAGTPPAGAPPPAPSGSAPLVSLGALGANPALLKFLQSRGTMTRV
jgi:hypothetical protein